VLLLTNWMSRFFLGTAGSARTSHVHLAWCSSDDVSQRDRGKARSLASHLASQVLRWYAHLLYALTGLFVWLVSFVRLGL
jgi:hypothetical protein